MNFDEWCYRVCEYQGILLRREPHEIYPLLDLTDAKLSFCDGVSPEKYVI